MKIDSEYLIYLLKNHIDDNWAIKAIDNMNESEAREILAKSSIFLSFSEKEGFGLPPLEAALAENIVIGYTGQGGKEFFKRPIFREIEQNDFVSYISEIKIAILEIESNQYYSPTLLEQKKNLVDKYSYTAILPSLLSMANTVNSSI